MTDTLEEFLTQVCPAIHAAGSGYYGAPLTLAKSLTLGLDGSNFPFYVIGRGGMLGDVDSALVSSSFGYFRPSYIHETWDSARAIVSPVKASLAHFECCAEVGRSALAGVGEMDAYCKAAAAVNDAADPVGLPLYAGFKGATLASDPLGRAMQLTAVLRELRGSAHLLAVRACGIDAKSAHLMERPHMAAAFGWSTDEVPLATAAQRKALRESESLTDDLLRPAFAVLDATSRDSLIGGARSILEALLAAGWGGPTKLWSTA